MISSGPKVRDEDWVDLLLLFVAVLIIVLMPIIG